MGISPRQPPVNQKTLRIQEYQNVTVSGWKLDYLGPGLKQLYDIPEFVTTKANNFIASQIIEKADDEKVVKKYLKTQEYFARNGIM